MPIGDGTGPFGNGPLNRFKRGKRASGRNANRAGNSDKTRKLGRKKSPIQNSDRNRSLTSGYLGQVSSLLLGLLTTALPVFLKLQQRIQDSRTDHRVDWEKPTAPVITIATEGDKLSDNRSEIHQQPDADR